MDFADCKIQEMDYNFCKSCKKGVILPLNCDIIRFRCHYCDTLDYLCEGCDTFIKDIVPARELEEEEFGCDCELAAQHVHHPPPLDRKSTCLECNHKLPAPLYAKYRCPECSHLNFMVQAEISCKRCCMDGMPCRECNVFISGIGGKGARKAPYRNETVRFCSRCFMHLDAVDRRIARNKCTKCNRICYSCEGCGKYASTTRTTQVEQAFPCDCTDFARFAVDPKYKRYHCTDCGIKVPLSFKDGEFKYKCPKCLCVNKLKQTEFECPSCNRLGRVCEKCDTLIINENPDFVNSSEDETVDLSDGTVDLSEPIKKKQKKTTRTCSSEDEEVDLNKSKKKQKKTTRTQNKSCDEVSLLNEKPSSGSPSTEHKSIKLPSLLYLH